MKKYHCVLAVLVLGVFALSSCAQMQGGNQQAMGTGAGAVGGAILGQMIGRSTEATLIGGAIGALVGYVAATHIESQTTKVYNAQQTKAHVPESRVTGPVLDIQNTTIDPSQQIKPGENVTVMVTYVVFDQHLESMPVRETKTIWHNGQKIMVLGDEVAYRENGTYESKVSFQVPDTIEKGLYEMRQEISGPSLAKSTSVSFNVI